MLAILMSTNMELLTSSIHTGVLYLKNAHIINIKDLFILCQSLGGGGGEQAKYGDVHL